MLAREYIKGCERARDGASTAGEWERAATSQERGDMSWTSVSGRTWLVWMSTLLSVGAGACVGEDAVRATAVIETTLPGYGVVITVPDTVRRGSSFDVRFVTYGNGCVRPGVARDIEVRREGDVLTFVPWDYRLRPAGGPSALSCSDELNVFQREATFRFANPGRGTIRMIGISKRQEPPSAITVTREVVVEGGG